MIVSFLRRLKLGAWSLGLAAFFLFNFRLNFSDPRSSEAVGWFPTIPLHAGSGIRCNCYSPALTRVSITQPDPRSMLFAHVAVHTQALITWIRDQASNPIFNVVSPHMRAGFGLIPFVNSLFDLLHYPYEFLIDQVLFLIAGWPGPALQRAQYSR